MKLIWVDIKTVLRQYPEVEKIDYYSFGGLLMIGLAFAMGTPPGGGAGGAQSGITSLIPLVIMFAIFYFLLIRPQQKKANALRSIIEEPPRSPM